MQLSNFCCLQRKGVKNIHTKHNAGWFHTTFWHTRLSVFDTPYRRAVDIFQLSSIEECLSLCHSHRTQSHMMMFFGYIRYSEKGDNNWSRMSMLGFVNECFYRVCACCILRIEEKGDMRLFIYILISWVTLNYSQISLNVLEYLN